MKRLPDEPLPQFSILERAGREPGIYSNADDFEKQLTKFPNAKGRRFHTLPEAQRFMKARGKADQTLSAKTRQVITQAAKVNHHDSPSTHIHSCCMSHN